MKQNIVKFKGWKCIPIYAKYHNGTVSIRLIDAEDGSPIATATVNIVKEQMYDRNYKSSDQLEPNQVYIKTWSEGQGMVEALEAAGIVKFLGMVIPMNPYGDNAALVEIIDKEE